jgi:hypothetical protein
MVSTLVNSPLHPLPKAGWSDETVEGSKLDQHHPAGGVNIPCLITFARLVLLAVSQLARSSSVKSLVPCFNAACRQGMRTEGTYVQQYMRRQNVNLARTIDTNWVRHNQNDSIDMARHLKATMRPLARRLQSRASLAADDALRDLHPDDASTRSGTTFELSMAAMPD